MLLLVHQVNIVCTMKIAIPDMFSEADDYSKNTSKKAAFRVLLVNRVVVGKPYKRLHNATNLTEPPSGYHSVWSYIWYT